MFGLAAIKSINANYRMSQEYAKALNTNEPHDIATLGKRKSKSKGKGGKMSCSKSCECGDHSRG